MQIEIGEKEKTALSLMLGLRQKFAREKRSDLLYSPKELHTLFSELINKINKSELRYLDTITVAHGRERGFGKTASQKQDKILNDKEKSGEIHLAGTKEDLQKIRSEDV